MVNPVGNTLSIRAAIPDDVIFFLENIAAMTAVRARLGQRQPANFVCIREAPSSRLISYDSQRAVELVQQIYARDFQVFNDSTEISEASPAPGAYVGLRGVVDDGADPLDEPAAGVSALIPIVRFQRLVEMRLL